MTIKNELHDKIAKTLAEIGASDIKVVVDYPADPKHGDYATNVALIAAKKLGKNPLEVAEDLRSKIKDLGLIEKVEIAGPGFINFWIKKEEFAKKLEENLQKIGRNALSELFKGKKVTVEYTDPNPFKEFHIGHLYSNIVGESVARLKEALGAEVWRADYFGDVGMHVAKSIWGLLKKFAEDNKSIEELGKLPLEERIAYFGQAYALGATAYEGDDDAKEQMKELNFLIFKAAQEVVLPAKNKEPEVNYDQFIKPGKYNYEDIKHLYAIGREWSLAYFETIYARLGTKFDGYYPESVTGEYGYGMVMDGLEKNIFEKGEGGAIIFPGSKYGLHERVFINALGLPTYETKDFGNAVAKQKDVDYDESVIVTGNEINDYFHVVLKALSMLYPELGAKTKHIGHGMVRLPEGKMSSRTGKIKTGESLLNEAKERALSLSEAKDEGLADQIGQAAIKYALLKQSVGRDVIFDFDESISFEGNSGPYLQYSFARTQSVLAKAGAIDNAAHLSGEVTVEERELLKQLSRFTEVVEDAGQRLSPNVLCQYLFEVAQSFNLFYQKCPILKAEGESKNFRLFLTSATADMLNKGLDLLGIKAPEKM